ncbi:MAG: hypothetical protein ACK50G_00720 [bacterium]|jgi:hypothetical protein
MLNISVAARALALCGRALQGQVVAVSLDEHEAIATMRARMQADDPLALVPNPNRVGDADAYLMGPADRPEMITLGLIAGLQAASRVPA